MTQKHFIALADAFKRIEPETRAAIKGNDPAWDQWSRCLDAVIGVCIKANPKFNPVHFRNYVAGTVGPVGRAR